MTRAMAERTPSEACAHLSDSQLLFVLQDAAQMTGQGKPVRLDYPGGFDIVDVLRRLQWDQREDADASFALGLEHVAKIGEVASMVAGRNGLWLNLPPHTFDQTCEIERLQIAARHASRRN